MDSNANTSSNGNSNRTSGSPSTSGQADWLSYFRPRPSAFSVPRLRVDSICLQPQYKSLDRLGRELLQVGDLFASPGGQFIYRVVGGPVCLLYDREQLPWPSCSLDWRGKQPSWRRIGKRLIPDIAGKHSACYFVELVGSQKAPTVKAISWVELLPAFKRWWYSIEMPAAEKDYWYRQEQPVESSAFQFPH